MTTNNNSKNNVIFKSYRCENQAEMDEFFAMTDKVAQRIAYFIDNMKNHTWSFANIVVTETYAIIESGYIKIAMGRYGFYPKRNYTVSYKWFPKSKKRLRSIYHVDRPNIKYMLSNTFDYAFVEHVPHECLSASVVKDILYKKLTNPHDVIKQYSKSYHIEGLNQLAIDASHQLAVSVSMMESAFDLKQLTSCWKSFIDRIDTSIGIYDTIRDMITQAIILNKKINLTWSTKRLQQEHVKWTEEIMNYQILSKSIEPVWSDHFVNQLQEHGLELINDEARAFKEGTMMHHCVYTNYWHRIKTMSYVALHIVLPDGPATIGLRLVEHPSKINLHKYTIDQVFHKYNNQLSSQECDIVHKVLTAAKPILDKMAHDASNKNNQTVEDFEDTLPF